MVRPERHVLVDCAWRGGVSTWAASCTCGWQSGPRDYYEDALEDFAQHRLDQSFPPQTAEE
jgi:hypothetical protein